MDKKWWTLIVVCAATFMLLDRTISRCTPGA
jgi:hypothetical protein